MYLDHTNFDYYVIDIEADSLTPSIIWCVVVQSITTDEVWKFRPNEMDKLRDFINKKERNKKTRWVGHNAITFDIPVLNRLLGTSIALDSIVDTMVLSYLYHPHMPGGHSLKAWGERLGDDKIHFEDFSKYTEEMLIYCVQDVSLTVRVFKALTKKMRVRGFSELSCEIEHKIRFIIDEQSKNGVLFDERAATLLLGDFESRKAQLEERIQTVFKPKLVLKGEYTYKLRQDGTPYASYQRHVERYPRLTWSNTRRKYRTWDYEDFNIDSPKQRVERLLALGWKPTEFTPITKKGGGGSPKVTEEALIDFAEESGIPEVELIKDYMLYSTRISSLKEWLGHVQDDGRIHGNVYSCGAGTRRMRHNKPNTANICGVDKPYGKEMRSLWRVPEGKKMVGIDAKGLEGRVLMHYLNNSAATAIFMEGDVHQMNRDAIAAAIKNEDKTRKTSKNDYYAFLYGASDSKLGKMNGGSRKVGGLVRAAIMGNVPGLENLTKECTSEYHSTSQGWMATIDGGFVRCPSPHAALNYRCQSAGGILMKLATILAYGFSVDSLHVTPNGAYVQYSIENSKPTSITLDNPWDLSQCLKILDVHDEVQLESEPDYAQECGQVYCDAITLAGELLEFNVKQEGDFNVGNNWAQTH